MNDNKHSELEHIVKKKLEVCKHQDQIVEDFNILFSEMKEIALYAAASKLPLHESARLTDEILKK